MHSGGWVEMTMPPVIEIKGLSKTYASGYSALRDIDLEIARGEIFALLGPNGAGKTTLISILCGIVNPTSGRVLVAGHDIARDYRTARSLIGLVPQELTTDAFETVFGTVSFSRGLFGKRADPALIEKILRDLTLWDKRDNKIITLSGGMKRRLMIAKALSHEPQVLFLDEPTAGVDVRLRREMWQLVHELRRTGVTIILTTHYIDEAEEMADRVGVINKGQIVLVEGKAALMRRFGEKQLTLDLQHPLERLPPTLAGKALVLSDDRLQLTYAYDANAEHSGISELLDDTGFGGHPVRDLRTTQSSLEDIFVKLVRGHAMNGFNWQAVRAIYAFEMARTRRTLMQSVISPVISTSLYFVVFGAAIGSRIPEVGGVSYGAFIVPGLIMLSLLTQSISNASFGIYFPKFSGTIYELLSAPVSWVEPVLGYVGAAASKSIMLGLIILATAGLFVPLEIRHPFAMLAFLVLTAITFSLIGFIIGVWADGFEKLQVVPLLIVTPLTFLGGTFYSIDMLPPFWQNVALLNPVVYLVSGFRWSFYGSADVPVVTSLAMTLFFLGLGLAAVIRIFRTGYKLRS